MAIGDGASILFRIKGDASDAVRAFNETKQAQGGLTGSTSQLTGTFGQLESVLGGSASGFAGLSSAMGPVSVALGIMTAATTAAIAALTGLFELSSSAAEFGSEIYDASQKTGLTADTLQALQTAAQQSGSSFEEITGAVSKFNVLLGEANEGNEKARATLEKYGVTATDTDHALQQAIKTIAEETDNTKQAAAAKALFKDRTAAILPVIKSFDGDLPGLINKLRDLGILIGDENVKAADAFGDQMDTLKAQLAAIGHTIGFAVLPIFLDMARSVSAWLAENKGAIATWATYIKYYLEGVIKAWQIYARVARIGLALARGDVIGASIETTLPLSTPGRDKGIAGGGALASAPSSTEPSAPGGGGRRGASSRNTEADRAQKEAEQRAQRELQATTQIELNNLSTQKDQLVKTIEDLRTVFEKDKSPENFIAGVADAFEKAKSNFAGTLEYVEQLERQALKADATQAERDLLTQKQQERRNELVQLGIDLNKKNQDVLQNTLDDQIEAWQKEGNAYGDKVEAQNKADRAREESLKKLIATTQEQIDQLEKQLSFSPENSADDGGLFGGWLGSWDDFFDQVSSEVGDLSSALTSFAGDIQDAFDGMANAMGRVVENWVLTGETGPAVMKKILASALATIAAEAAVRAIYATALGFFYLAIQDYASATNAFIAAAFFGAVAATTAIAGRAIAGDSFKRQSGSATSRSSGGSKGSSANQDPTPYSREQQNTYDSGNRGVFGRMQDQYFNALTDAINRHADATEKLDKRISSMPPKEVLTTAIKQSPGTIADAVHKDVQRDAGAGKKLNTALGMT